ncbi:hypothetical protein R1sor_005588 [Riccia sorocarpa]|uniref:DNA-directed RNA polymerase subunit n=1 Tax=Riccia sorocarpa TaxID=122646 RepID=A0ABD3HK95_9MARC
MEAAEAPAGGSPPWAGITGIQFGTMTRGHIVKMSVTEDSQASKPMKPRDVLVDAKLGLPTASRQCLTCNGATTDECQGHFSHINLPLPIFHPNHVEALVRVLRKICLNCGQPRRKSLTKLKSAKKIQPMLLLRGPDYDDPEDSSATRFNNQTKKPERASSDIAEEGFTNSPRITSKEKGSSKDVIIVSSESDEDLPSKRKRQFEITGDPVPSSSKASVSKKVRRSSRLISMPSGIGDVPASPSGSTRKRKLTGELNEPTKATTRADVAKFTASEGYKMNDFPASAMNRGYPVPGINVYVPARGRGKEEVLSTVKAIRMSVTPDELEILAHDFWDFVEGSSRVENSSRRASRYLLPSEALKILKRIPEKSFADLGLKADIARPEAFLLECIPIPPNCLRLEENGFGSRGTNIGFKLGGDRTTNTLERLLRKINSIRTARYSLPTFQAALMESSILQEHFQLYLREKGAPKSAPGQEKKRFDRSGRFQNSAGPSRWTLDWLKKNIIGKRSGYSARNVVTGDPYLSVDEIGVPLDVAKHVTCSERVTEFNKSTLQKYVEIGQDLSHSRACSALRIVRSGERREVTRRTTIELEIGDIVHRHLKDGDLVFINRPPSLHKHSLLALRARIQSGCTWTINPAICAPLHADFDGDCLHVFMPQTEEGKAELHELMTLPAQILPSADEGTICGLSQDFVLATHLLTSPTFVSREEMQQLGLWATKEVPVPTIVKSPKGGPLWTGRQVIDLTIPLGLSFQSPNKAVVIKDGELYSCLEKPNWLASTKGLVRIIADYHGAEAVKHLDSSQSVLREWLLTQGFSVSLADYYAASDHNQRRKMKQELDGSLEIAKWAAVGRKSIRTEEQIIRSNACTRRSHENVAVNLFRQSQVQITETLVASVPESNCLLAMVRSGSKGSSEKAMQQIGCLGLQVLNRDKLLSTEKNPKLVALARATGYSSEDDLQDAWETRGMVKSSLLDGLEPQEFFTHAISTRDAMFRQSEGISGPGELFKKLMLFLRDVHIGYDGTVRNRSGQEIIQFQYEGAKSINYEEDTALQDTETIFPGEPVGVLAATAISQPAYQKMLEACPGLGSRKIGPLDLLQESLFPRGDGKLKASDRRCILRLNSCSCDEEYCEQRRVLELQAGLQPVTLEMLATGVAVEFADELSEHWEAFEFGAEEMNQTDFPRWVGHIQIDQTLLVEKMITPNTILEKVRANCSVIQTGPRKHPRKLGNLVFCFRDSGDCDLSTGVPKAAETGTSSKAPCLHFAFLRAAKKKGRHLKTKQGRANDEMAKMLDTFHRHIYPTILNTAVKGFEEIESTSVVWEHEAWSTPRMQDVANQFEGELVLEVTVKQEYSTGRGKPWKIMIESSMLMTDYIDWRRSSPYGIQEIQTIFGVEGAQATLTKRLGLAAGDYVGKKHLKLVADLLGHSGEIHGLTFYGYRDWMRNLHFPIPFTGGIFRAPMKHFMEGGRKGISESLKGVLSSSVFGERVPVGTGTDFSLKLNIKPRGRSCRPSADSRCSEIGEQSIDILQCLNDLNSEIAAEYPPAVQTVEDQACETDGAQAESEWGASARHPQSEAGWSAPDNTDESIPSWGAHESNPSPADAWGTTSTCNAPWDSHGNDPPSTEVLQTASANQAERSTELASGNTESYTIPTDTWGRSACTSQREEEGASSGWAANSLETADPDANWS